MTEKEFYGKYCSLCGSISCAGIQKESEEILRGCPKYNEHILGVVKDDWRILFANK